jgi:hypothetical protein
MHDSRRCRALAVECLLAPPEPCDRHSRKLNLSMAAVWLFLARQDEVLDDLLCHEARPSPGLWPMIYQGSHARTRGIHGRP